MHAGAAKSWPFLEGRSEVTTWSHDHRNTNHISLPRIKSQLGGGFKYVLFSPRTLGKIPILTNIFQMGWNHQPVKSNRKCFNLVLQFPKFPIPKTRFQQKLQPPPRKQMMVNDSFLAVSNVPKKSWKVPTEFPGPNSWRFHITHTIHGDWYDLPTLIP